MKLLTTVGVALVILGVVATAYGAYLDSQATSILNLPPINRKEGPPALVDANRDGIIDWKDCDITNDGRVDIRDASLISRCYNKTIDNATDWNSPASPAYPSIPVSRCDLNGDGIIGQSDIKLFQQYFGSGMVMSIIDIGKAEGQFFVSGVAMLVLGLSIAFYSVTRKEVK